MIVLKPKGALTRGLRSIKMLVTTINRIFSDYIKH